MKYEYWLGTFFLKLIRFWVDCDIIVKKILNIEILYSEYK